MSRLSVDGMQVATLCEETGLERAPGRFATRTWEVPAGSPRCNDVPWAHALLCVDAEVPAPVSWARAPESGDVIREQVRLIVWRRVLHE